MHFTCIEAVSIEDGSTWIRRSYIAIEHHASLEWHFHDGGTKTHDGDCSSRTYAKTVDSSQTLHKTLKATMETNTANCE